MLICNQLKVHLDKLFCVLGSAVNKTTCLHCSIALELRCFSYQMEFIRAFSSEVCGSSFSSEKCLHNILNILAASHLRLPCHPSIQINIFTGPGFLFRSLLYFNSFLFLLTLGSLGWPLQWQDLIHVLQTDNQSEKCFKSSSLNYKSFLSLSAYYPKALPLKLLQCPRATRYRPLNEF